MKDPFKKTANYGQNSGGGGQDWIRNFMFEDGMSLPIQILNPPEDRFPDGFPLIKRHWITREENGKTKYLPPMQCTDGLESTGGHCLVCHAKAMGQITADRGNASASEEMIVPVYDHTNYRQVEGKYRPLNPSMPLMDPKARENLIVGGLKIMYVSESQYRKIRAEHDNLQNECGSCGGQMLLENLACEECGTPAYEPGQLAMLNTDDFNRIRYSPHTCETCQHSGLLDTNRKCGSCGSSEARTIFDSVLFANRNSTVNKKGKPRKEYVFSAASGHELAEIDSEELESFWQKLDSLVNSGMTIQQQAEKLGIQPPQEWLQALPGSAAAARSYGG